MAGFASIAEFATAEFAATGDAVLLFPDPIDIEVTVLNPTVVVPLQLFPDPVEFGLELLSPAVIAGLPTPRRVVNAIYY
jgi:hypothetical protein